MLLMLTTLSGETFQVSLSVAKFDRFEEEQLEECPIHHIPPAVHVSMNLEGVVPEGAFAGVHACDMSV